MIQGDNDLATVRYVPVTRRAGLDTPLFRRYWGDVHGPMCAGIPGLFVYQQFHLRGLQPRLWRTTRALRALMPGDLVFDGIAECSFRTEADFERWLNQASCLEHDERNAFDGTYGYYTLSGGSRTAKYPGPEAASLAACVFLRKQRDVRNADFTAFLLDRLVPVLAGSDAISGLRYHLFQPYEQTSARWHAAEVDHGQPEAHAYQAAISFVARDAVALDTFFSGAAYAEVLAQQDNVIGAAHAYEVERAPVLVRAGEVTLAGRRGVSVEETILQVGASNAMG